MPAPIGFVLVTHNRPEQTAYLCRQLARLFDKPPIAIHHDYSQSYLDPATLPVQVKIVQNWVKTGWGASSVIDAYLAALRLLHIEDGPDWTINLSSADYPVRTAQDVLADLQNAQVDAFMDFRDVSRTDPKPANARSMAASFQLPSYLTLARKRYLAVSTVHYHLRKLIGRADRSFYLSNGWTDFFMTPFSREFRPYAGDWWHTINRRAARVLLATTRKTRALRRYYEKRDSVEESYFHSVLLNHPDLRVENNNRRFTIWELGAAHPKTLDAADVAALVASGAHFARKFPFDEELYRTVDQKVAEASLRSNRV